MHVQLLFGIFLYLFDNAKSEGGSGASINYCDALTDCLSNALRTEEDCQTQLERQNAGTTTTGRPSKGGQACSPAELASIKDNMRRLNGKKVQQIEQFKQCITDRKSQSYDVGAIGQKQRLTCERAVVSTKNSSSTTSRFSGRKIRQASGGKGIGWTKSKGAKGKSQGRGGERSCRSGVQYAYGLCKRLEKCCSETTICKLKFEVSDLHDQTRQLQLDSATKQHDCVRAKVSPNGA